MAFPLSTMPAQDLPAGTLLSKMLPADSVKLNWRTVRPQTMKVRVRVTIAILANVGALH